jgi:hypothetical protein
MAVLGRGKTIVDRFENRPGSFIAGTVRRVDSQRKMVFYFSVPADPLTVASHGSRMLRCPRSCQLGHLFPLSSING